MSLKDYDKIENTNIDYKEKVEYLKPKSWLKSVSAFANSNGGSLLFGIRDADYFMIRMYKCLPSNTRKKTYTLIQKLFDIYMYRYEFRRDNIEEIFNVKKSRASEIIALLLNSNLIEESNPTKYKFKR